MATSMAPAPQQQTKPLEDPLAYLPCSTIIECRKGQAVYGQDQPSRSLYLVLEGKVTIYRGADEGQPVIVDVYQTDEFFGETSFVGESLNQSQRTETAIALENSRLMVWTVSEIEDLVTRRPLLAVALIQLLVQRAMDFGRRIESFSVDNIPRRLAGALIRFSDRMGSQDEDGSIKMMPLTHEFLAQYVGTSREIITHYMTGFRRQGYLRYSRRGIQLYRDAMKDWMRQKALAA
jgi:CRP/FNR family transcriptional regulator, cyclic AMP receptor protein